METETETTQLTHETFLDLTRVQEAIEKHGQTYGHLVWLSQLHRKNGYAFSPMQWMLDNGARFKWSPAPRHLKRGTPKYCHWNALQLARKGRGRYVYMEGWASNLITAEHSWCYDRKTGLIVDTTWEEGVDYIGVPVKLDYAVRVMVNFNSRRQEPGVLRCAVHNWQDDYPIQRGAVPVEEWREEL
jgi:hypothetical protein